MSDTIKKLVGGFCPLAATDVFTAIAKTSLLAIDIANPTGSTQGVTIKISGVTLFSVMMPSKGGVSWHGPQVLEIGDKINLVSDSASCEYNVSGVEIV
jgi:hypothetical protein